MEAKALIKKLGLTPHPEGGYYRRVYESKELCCPNYTDDTRPTSTAIYYLLEKGDFSAFHRLKSDEIWHFHKGDAMKIYSIDTAGSLSVDKLGVDLEAGELPMKIISSGTWFAAEPLGAYSLVGCTVSPGFDFADFELAQTSELEQKFARHKALIRRFERSV